MLRQVGYTVTKVKKTNIIHFETEYLQFIPNTNNVSLRSGYSDKNLYLCAMKRNILYKIIYESLLPCVFLTVAFFVFQPFGSAYNTLMEYFFHVVLCEVSACFIGCFLSLLISYYAFHYRFDTKETTLEQTKKLIEVYALCIPLTALFLYVINHLFLPLEVNQTVPGYPEFWPSFVFYCSMVCRYCIFFFVIDVFVYRHRKMKHEFDEMRAINEMLKSYQEDWTATAVVQNFEKSPTHLSIGQNDNLELDFAPESLIYVESVANYAEVCYLCDREIKTISLRSTLKQIKDSLCVQDSIIQCHRGFIVNLNFVETLRCENNSYYLNLFYIDKKIPVSRTRKADIKATLSALQHN